MFKTVPMATQLLSGAGCSVSQRLSSGTRQARAKGLEKQVGGQARSPQTKDWTV